MSKIVTAPKEWPALGKEEIAKMRDEFKSINTNGDNVISSDELKKMWLKIHNGDIDEERLDSMVQGVIAVADLDGDGHINFEEFLNLCTVDTELRFDVAFVRHQRAKASDQLGLAFYIPFLILFVIYLVTGKGVGRGYSYAAAALNSITGNEFGITPTNSAKFFSDISDTGNLFDWMNGPLLNSFWGSDNTSDARGKVFWQSRGIGALKIRQARIVPRACSDGVQTLLDLGRAEITNAQYLSRMNEFTKTCYPDPIDGDPARDLTYNNLPDGTLSDPENPWMYRGCSQLNGSMRVYGRHTTYPCGGNAMVLPFAMSRADVNARIDILKNGITGKDGNTVPWIDEATRAIIVEFITYNQNIRMFLFGQFLVEITAGGALFPSRTIVLFDMHQWSDHTTAYWFFFFVYFLYVIGYALHFVYRIQRDTAHRMNQKRQFGWRNAIKNFSILVFRDPWIPFDFINLSIFVVVFALRFAWMQMGLKGQSPLQTSNYPNYEDIANVYHALSMLDAMNALLCFVRIFYYVRLNGRLNVLTNTVERALPSLVGIIVVFFIVFTGFALMGMVAFGHISEEFKDWDATVSALSRMLVGDFDYPALRAERREFTGVFFVLYIILCVFLLLNMVIAVLSDAFGEVEGAKYDFSPITSVMSMVKSELNAKNLITQVTEFPIFLEFRFWAYKFYYQSQRISGKIDEPTYDRAVEAISYQCPRMYWRFLENQLLNRTTVIDFASKLKYTPVGLNDKLSRTFGKDWALLRDKVIHPTVEKVGISEHTMLLDIVEFHHEWFQRVELYCDPCGDEEPESHAHNSFRRKSTAAAGGGNAGAINAKIRELEGQIFLMNEKLNDLPRIMMEIQAGRYDATATLPRKDSNHDIPIETSQQLQQEQSATEPITQSTPR
eukprot:PhF_6_TR36471/c0_g1_i1/m.53529/K04990/PKD2L1; polycystin 2L1